MKVKDYLKARLSERSTHAGLALIGVTLLQIFFPQYSTIINLVASALGVGAVALPTSSGNKEVGS